MKFNSEAEPIITEKELNQVLRPLARKLYIWAQEFGEAACPVECWLEAIKDDLEVLLKDRRKGKRK